VPKKPDRLDPCPDSLERSRQAQARYWVKRDGLPGLDTETPPHQSRLPTIAKHRHLSGTQLEQVLGRNSGKVSDREIDIERKTRSPAPAPNGPVAVTTRSARPPLQDLSPGGSNGWAAGLRELNPCQHLAQHEASLASENGCRAIGAAALASGLPAQHGRAKDCEALAKAPAPIPLGRNRGGPPLRPSNHEARCAIGGVIHCAA